MKTSIIILTHNQLELTKQCLDSIRVYTPEDHEVIVVDNGSTDGTVEYLHSETSIKAIYNTENLGFPKGCNQGIQVASGDDFLFLNNDTVVTENWLTNMHRALYQEEQVGMVGPTTNYASGPQQIPTTYRDQRSLQEFARKQSSKNSLQYVKVRRLAGFCLLVKKSVVDKIGGFDEQFGLGNFEDDDLCLRALNEDFTLLIAMDSFVHHVGHATTRNLADVDFSQLLEENRRKAKEKWGRDIHELLFCPGVTVSLCMIVKNEERTLKRCLDSVREVLDEIIIVDTGSTDQTKQIARQYTEKVFDFQWIDDFSTARNFSFSKATMDYILWLDADDVLLEPHTQSLLELKSNLNPSIDVVLMPYNLSLTSDGKVVLSVQRERLVKRSCQFRWEGAVHEYLVISGTMMNADIAVTHSPVEHDFDRNIKIYQRRIAAGEEFSPRDLFYYANECLDHHDYEQAITHYHKFLDTNHGRMEDNITACGKLADCYLAINDRNNTLRVLLRSLEYDVPRADICCRLGYEFLNANEIEKSIFWYKMATQSKESDSQSYVNHACYTWLPHLQLGVCYDHLGQPGKAYYHNELARTFVPNEPVVLHNRKYLLSLARG